MLESSCTIKIIKEFINTSAAYSGFITKLFINLGLKNTAWPMEVESFVNYNYF
jgi:hypothetical protein